MIDYIYQWLARLLIFILEGVPSIKGLKISYLVNIQKGCTGLMVYSLMFYNNNFNPGCYLYLSLHGVYGLIWLLKDLTFPDKTLQRDSSILSLPGIIILLSLYWLPPYLLTSGLGIQSPSPHRILLCFLLNTLGVALMISSDCQKNFTLQYKSGLITNGLFKYTRSPNYLGEIMIYSSFAVCVGIFEVYFMLATILGILLGTFIKMKEDSNRKKIGWKEYEKHSFVLLPKIVPGSSVISCAIYVAAFAGGLCVLRKPDGEGFYY